MDQAVGGDGWFGILEHPGTHRNLLAFVVPVFYRFISYLLYTINIKVNKLGCYSVQLDSSWEKCGGWCFFLGVGGLTFFSRNVFFMLS